MPTHLGMNDGPRAGYRQHQQRRGLLASSIKASDYILDRFELWLGRCLTGASTAEVETWLDSRYRVARTRYCAISTLHGFYRWAEAEGMVEQDPTVRVVRPRLRTYVPRPIRSEDLARALELAPPIIRAWLCLGAFMGLRCQEIAGLRVEDVMGDLVLVHMGKGHHERLVPLNRHVRDALRRLPIPQAGPVFTRDGRPFTPTRVSQVLNTYLRGVGVSTTAHQLRHYFATRVYEETRDLRLTQELLGHASPTTTAIYTAWSPTRAAEVVRDLSVSD